MNGLIVLLVIVTVISIVWALSPAITNTKTGAGNWYYVFPVALVFGLLAAIAWLFGLDLPWILGLLFLSSVFLVRAIALRSQNRKFQFSDD